MKQAPCKGDAFLADAEKALARTTIFGFGKNQKHEDAAEAYTKAGNAFKLASLWESAGKAYVKAAEQHHVLNSSSDAANQYVEAGNCYRKIAPKKAVKAYQKAIEIYNEAGRFSQSARYYKEVAEVCEADNNPAGAIDAYQQAANLFSSACDPFPPPASSLSLSRRLTRLSFARPRCCC
jgi:alpha-soluble NSF attachment protein